MSYTNIDLVNNHLTLPLAVSNKIFDQQLIFDSNELITFFGGVINESSLLVKSLQQTNQSSIDIIIEDGEAQISNLPIVRGSLLVADSSSLSVIYTENIDYIIDYEAGKMTVKEGGILTNGMSVTVFYIPFHLYQSGVDFSLDNKNGRMRRLSSGSIALGERIFLDYQPEYISFTDESLSAAVKEANSIISQIIDPNQEFEADPVLQAAATYRALEILCRSSAIRELTSQNKDDKTSAAWLKLSESYRTESDKLLASFKEPITDVSQPTHG